MRKRISKLIAIVIISALIASLVPMNQTSVSYAVTHLGGFNTEEFETITIINKDLEGNVSLEQAKEIARNIYSGSSYIYVHDFNFERSNGERYYIIRIKDRVDNHYTSLTQLFISFDGKICVEGYSTGQKIYVYSDDNLIIKTKVLRAYRKILFQENNLNEEEDDFKSYFSICDFNADGIYDLILSEGEHILSEKKYYTFENDRVVEIEGPSGDEAYPVYGCLYSLPSRGTYAFYRGGPASEDSDGNGYMPHTIMEYKLENHKIKLINNLYCAEYQFGDKTGLNEYYLNGKQCTAEYYQSIYNSFSNQIIFYPNSEINRLYWGINNSGDFEKEEGKHESKQNELEQKALTLIKNTNGRENPLLEYNDPENLFCGYAMSLAAQSAVYVYGDEFSKNKLWVGGYERCLDALFAENNLTKILSDCEISKFVEVVNNTKELIDMAVTDKLSTMIKATDGVDLVNILKLSDSFIRAKLQYYDGCVAILCQIMDNTNNENLKEACRVVMNDRYTFVIEEIEKQMMECFVENGIVLLEQNSEILGEFLAQYIALGAGEIATIIACSAEALSYVKAVVVAKDIISEFTGLRKRVENYLDAICFNTIYFASVNSYNNSLKKINSKQYEEKDISNFISMFEFIVKVKQKQYDCMNNMFTPDKLQKIKAADNYIDQHIMSLNKITIDNYRKVELQKLTPIVNLKQSMKKGMKSNIKVTGIAYKGKVTYKSTNKKVAKVNSSGKVTAKKSGSTKIIIKIKQYGEELKIEKEVKVHK